MQPFTVAWDDAALKTLRTRIRAYPFPPPLAAPDWTHGCDPGFLADLCAYWTDGFDAQAAAADLNRFPQIVTEIAGTTIHAVHVVGEAQGRRPLLLVHGWPGSTFEFWQVIGPLAFPSRHGGRAEDAFDLVIPSLPGFGFSGKPAHPVGARATARLFDALMQRLGYRHYLAQGGDWGSAVCSWLALEHPASLRSIHLNFMLVHPRATPETAEEKAWATARDKVQFELGAYAQLQGTKPRSLAYAMADNPVAQAAWIIERFHDWSDRRAKPFAQVFSRDQLLTNVMIYVMNDAFVSSTWYYAAAITEGVRQIPEGARITVPTAFAAFPDPRSPAPPRRWAERGYDIVRWTDQPRGGHFAALEEPGLFVDDLRGWAGAL